MILYLTVNSEVIIPELGNRVLDTTLINYPFASSDGSLEFDIDEIRKANSLQDAIDSGNVSITDDEGNVITDLSLLQTSAFSIDANKVELVVSNSIDWKNPSSPPNKINLALDELANRVKSIETRWPIVPFYGYAESDPVTSSTSTSFIEKVNLSVIIPYNGNYLVEFCADVTSSATNRHCIVEFRRGNEVLNQQRICTVSSSHIHPSSSFKIINLNQGNENFSIHFASSNAGSIVSIRNARIKITRMS